MYRSYGRREEIIYIIYIAYYRLYEKAIIVNIREKRGAYDISRSKKWGGEMLYHNLTKIRNIF